MDLCMPSSFLKRKDKGEQWQGQDDDLDKRYLCASPMISAMTGMKCYSKGEKSTELASLGLVGNILCLSMTTDEVLSEVHSVLKEAMKE